MDKVNKNPRVFDDSDGQEIKLQKSGIPDSIIPRRAKLSLPCELAIEIMASGSHSVCAKELIKRGTRFGPLEAKKLFSLDPGIIFPVKIFTQSDYFSEYYLDTNNDHECNWMMYVEPAANVDEQNLMCFQEGHKIYFVSLCDIQPREFLKVWYSPFYAKQMDVPLLSSYNNVVTSNTNDSNDEQANLDLDALLKKQQKILHRDIWTCKFCSIQEKNVVKFAKHILEHYSLQAKKVCTICKSAFATQKRLQKHLQVVHGDANNIQFTSSKITPSSFHCSGSKLNDSSLGGPLLNDILTDSTDNTHLLLPQMELSQFDICHIDNQNVLLGTENLNLSVDNLLNENGNFNLDIGEFKEQIVCDICLKPFMKLKCLVQHLQKHTGRFKCPECLLIFCRKENLTSHKCAYNQYKHKCSLCGKIFGQRKHLLHHIEMVHKRKRKCSKCLCTYYSDKNSKHTCCSEIVEETQERNYQCSMCSKTFHKDIYLRRHLKRHSVNEKKDTSSHICDVCPKVFRSIKYLQRHMKNHSKPVYTCEKCGKNFSRRDILQNHIKSHYSEDVQCKFCDKTFKTRKSLQGHIIVHSNNKRFKCTECDEHFFTKRHMLRHQRNRHEKQCQLCNVENCNHSKNMPKLLDYYYQCYICGRIVKLRTSLVRHFRKLHPDDEIDYSKFEKIKYVPTLSDVESHKSSNVDDKSNINCGDGSQHEEMPDCHEFYDCDKRESVCSTQEMDNLCRSRLDNCDTSDIQSVFDKLDLIVSSNGTQGTDDTALDFSNIHLDVGTQLNVPENLNNQEVCLSMPELDEMDQGITLGENAYMLDNGTIVEPINPGNVVVYLLDKQFESTL